MEHLHLCAAPPHNTGKKYSRPTKIITKIVPKQAIPISNAKWASEPLSEDFHSPPCCPFLCLSVFPLSATPRITPTAPPPPLLHPVEPLLAGLLPDWGSTKDVHTRKMVTRRRPATEGGKGSMILFFLHFASRGKLLRGSSSRLNCAQFHDRIKRPATPKLSHHFAHGFALEWGSKIAQFSAYFPNALKNFHFFFWS